MSDSLRKIRVRSCTFPWVAILIACTIDIHYMAKSIWTPVQHLQPCWTSTSKLMAIIKDDVFCNNSFWKNLSTRSWGMSVVQLILKVFSAFEVKTFPFIPNKLCLHGGTIMWNSFEPLSSSTVGTLLGPLDLCSIVTPSAPDLHNNCVVKYRSWGNRTMNPTWMPLGSGWGIYEAWPGVYTLLSIKIKSIK